MFRSTVGRGSLRCLSFPLSVCGHKWTLKCSLPRTSTLYLLTSCVGQVCPNQSLSCPEPALPSSYPLTSSITLSRRIGRQSLLKCSLLRTTPSSISLFGSTLSHKKQFIAFIPIHVPSTHVLVTFLSPRQDPRLPALSRQRTSEATNCLDREQQHSPEGSHCSHCSAANALARRP